MIVYLQQMTLEINTLHAWHLLHEAANECGVSSVMPCKTQTDDMALLYWFPSEEEADEFVGRLFERPEDSPALVQFRPDPLAVVVRMPTRYSEHLAYLAGTQCAN